MGGIEQRRLWSVSPSAVTTYQKCKRLWFRQYVQNDRGIVPAFLAKGTAIHFAILEAYLAKGEMLIQHEVSDAPGVLWPVLEFTQAAIPHLPKPVTDPFWDPYRAEGKCGIFVEQSASLGTWVEPDGTYGPQWNQFIDLTECWEDRAVITDIKTLSDFRYCLTPDELSTNCQLVANAKWLFTQSDYKEITLRHLYLLTKSKRPKAMPVEVVVTCEHVEQEWQKLLVTVREMDAYARLTEDANTMPPSTDHCSAYGGCRFRAPCGFAGVSDLIQIGQRSRMKENEKMGLLDTMARNATALLPAATEPAAKVQPKLGGLAALLMKKAEPAAEVLTPEVAQEAAVAAGYPENLVTTGRTQSQTPNISQAPKIMTAGDLPGYEPNGIVPPDAPIPTSTPEEVAEANGESANGESANGESANGESVNGGTEEVLTSVEEVSSVEEITTTKRKRRTKAEMAAARAAEEAALSLATPGERVVVTVDTSSGTTAAIAEPIPVVTPSFITNTTETGAAFTNTGPDPATILLNPGASIEVEESEADKCRRALFTPDPAFTCGTEILFIDCLPGKGWASEQPTDLNDVMHRFASLAASSAEKADYRLIRFESKGYLATAIRVYQKGLPKVMFVDTRTPGADVFLEVVVPYCSMVFRGVR